MKILRPIHVCRALLALALTTAAVAAERDEVPESIRQGLRTYSESNYNIATEIWMKNISAEQPGDLKKEFLSLGRIEHIYGSYEGYDLVQQVTFSPRTKRVYLVMYFERGPLWIYFDVFQRKDNTWLINGVRSDLNAEEILPESRFRLGAPGPRPRP